MSRRCDTRFCCAVADLPGEIGAGAGARVGGAHGGGCTAPTVAADDLRRRLQRKGGGPDTSIASCALGHFSTNAKSGHNLLRLQISKLQIKFWHWSFISKVNTLFGFDIATNDLIVAFVIEVTFSYCLLWRNVFCDIYAFHR